MEYTGFFLFSFVFPIFKRLILSGDSDYLNKPETSVSTSEEIIFKSLQIPRLAKTSPTAQ